MPLPHYALNDFFCGDPPRGCRLRNPQLAYGVPVLNARANVAHFIMMTISSPQYVWTLFSGSFQKTTGSILSEVQWTITILIVIQTWLSPAQGWLVERFGPKMLIGLGAALSGAGRLVVRPKVSPAARSYKFVSWR